MTSAKPRSVFLYCLIGATVLYSVSLYLDNQALVKSNRTLLEQSHSFQKSLEVIQAQYQVLMSGAQNSGRELEDLAAANKEFQATIESLKKQNESLAFQAQKIESQISSVREEKAYLEEMLINKSKQIEILKSSSSSSIGLSEDGTEEVQGHIREKDDELKKLNDQNRILQEKLDRLYKTANDKIHEINVAKIALSETVSTAQKRIEDEWNTVNLGSVTTSAMPAPEPTHLRQTAVESQEPAREPKSEGHVLAINSEHGFVVIDLGKVDNLSSDAMLEVKKNGVAIATLSVLEIRDAMAACNIKDLADGQRIEINDPVSILR